jgi:8-oxo-dGTP diphosphatase
VYRTREYQGTPRETREAAPLWTPLDAIPYDRMWEDDHIWLPMMIEGRKFQSRWIFDGDRMVDYELIDHGQSDSWAPARGTMETR